MRIALAGNPNSGKTTLFNAITGRIEHVGNWPGVTVSKMEGDVKGTDQLGRLSTRWTFRSIFLHLSHRKRA